MGAKLVIIPGGLTQYIQAIDVGFAARCRAQYGEYYTRFLEETPTDMRIGSRTLYNKMIEWLYHATTETLGAMSTSENLGILGRRESTSGVWGIHQALIESFFAR